MVECYFSKRPSEHISSRENAESFDKILIYTYVYKSKSEQNTGNWCMNGRNETEKGIKLKEMWGLWVYLKFNPTVP